MSAGSVTFHVEDVTFQNLNEDRINAWVQNSVGAEGKLLGDVNCVFCSDKYLLEINKTYLNHDTFTDIVTFNYVENDIISGDLFISVETGKRKCSFIQRKFSPRTIEGDNSWSFALNWLQ